MRKGRYYYQQQYDLYAEGKNECPFKPHRKKKNVWLIGLEEADRTKGIDRIKESGTVSGADAKTSNKAMLKVVGNGFEGLSHAGATGSLLLAEKGAGSDESSSQGSGSEENSDGNSNGSDSSDDDSNEQAVPRGREVQSRPCASSNLSIKGGKGYQTKSSKPVVCVE